MLSKTPNRLDVSPIRRNRQFSQIRQDHSQYRPKTSVTGSRNTTSYRPIQSQMVVQSKYEPKKRNQTEHSPTKNLCVGCFNKQLYQAKMQKKKQAQEQAKKSQINFGLIDQDQEQYNNAKSRYNRQFDQVNKYNKEKMMLDKQRKQKQKSFKQKGATQNQLTLLQENKQKQRIKNQIQQQKLQQLRRDLKQQINLKKLKQQNDKNQRNTPVPGIFGQSTERGNVQRDIQQRYRKSLLQQISQNKQRKQIQQQQKNKRLKQLQLQNMQEAAEKDRSKRLQAERRQKMIEEDARKMKQYQAAKQQKKRQSQKQQEDQLAQQQNAIRQQKRKAQQQKKQKLDRYIDDLKKQIALNQEKKRKQYNYLNDPTPPRVFIEKLPVPERQCDSCEKKFPQRYLTKVSSPIKL